MNVRNLELLWYKKHGLYPDRIRYDSDGIKYVEGDFSWNLKIENKDRREFIENKMIFASYSPDNLPD